MRLTPEATLTGKVLLVVFATVAAFATIRVKLVLRMGWRETGWPELLACLACLFLGQWLLHL